MQTFHHRKQSVGIILSIIVTSWLLWLPFGDAYGKVSILLAKTRADNSKY